MVEGSGGWIWKQQKLRTTGGEGDAFIQGPKELAGGGQLYVGTKVGTDSLHKPVLMLFSGFLGLPLLNNPSSPGSYHEEIKTKTIA